MCKQISSEPSNGPPKVTLHLVGRNLAPFIEGAKNLSHTPSTTWKQD